jgi:hypothetical protein
MLSEETTVGWQTTSRHPEASYSVRMSISRKTAIEIGCSGSWCRSCNTVTNVNCLTTSIRAIPCSSYAIDLYLLRISAEILQIHTFLSLFMRMLALQRNRSCRILTSLHAWLRLNQLWWYTSPFIENPLGKLSIILDRLREYPVM